MCSKIVKYILFLFFFKNYKQHELAIMYLSAAGRVSSYILHVFMALITCNVLCKHFIFGNGSNAQCTLYITEDKNEVQRG
jgi:hypothetical protein